MKREWGEFYEAIPTGALVHVFDATRERCWRNNLYQVIEHPKDPREIGLPETARFVHLSIKRLDQEAVHDWRDMQRIKNEIVGPEAEAIELYPAESRLVDNANQYHLWCIVGMMFPFGFETRIVTAGGRTKVGSVQRDFYEGEQPDDALTPDEADTLMEITFKKIDEHRRQKGGTQS